MGAGQGKTRRTSSSQPKLKTSSSQPGPRIASGAKGSRIASGAKKSKSLTSQPTSEKKLTSMGNDAATTLGMAEHRWDEFIDATGIRTAKLLEYYRVEDVSDYDKLGIEKIYEQVTAELFKDVVEVGMIRLPTIYKVEDFKFELDKTSHSLMMSIGLKSAPEIPNEKLFIASSYFTKRTRMDDWHVSAAAKEIYWALSALLSEHYSARIGVFSKD